MKICSSAHSVDPVCEETRTRRNCNAKDAAGPSPNDVLKQWALCPAPHKGYSGYTLNASTLVANAAEELKLEFLHLTRQGGMKMNETLNPLGIFRIFRICPVSRFKLRSVALLRPARDVQGPQGIAQVVQAASLANLPSPSGTFGTACSSSPGAVELQFSALARL